MYQEKQIAYLRDSFQIFNIKRLETFLISTIEKRKKQCENAVEVSSELIRETEERGRPFREVEEQARKIFAPT
jgi:hypothetical protein